MRPSRSWWTFGLFVALTWCSWRTLRSDRPGSQDGRPERGDGRNRSSIVPAPPEPGQGPIVPEDFPHPAEEPGDLTGPDIEPGDLPRLSVERGDLSRPAAEAGDLPGLAAVLADDHPARAESETIRLGEEARQAGRLAEAEQIFRTALDEPGPRSLEPMTRLAEVLWLEGRFD